MATPAEVSDLQARWPFPGSVPSTGQIKLDEAWRLLQQSVPSVPSRIADASLDEEIVVDVLCSAVLRVLDNPSGYVEESVAIDDRTKTVKRDPERFSNDLYFTASELRRVSVVASGGSAFTIRPAGRTQCNWE